MKNRTEYKEMGEEIHTMKKEQEKKTPEREAPTYNELLREVRDMIRISNYRQIWIIRDFIKAVLGPGD
ncbi:MAG: hypothetical protein LUE11_04955 [Clostridia bacterium]|nr:hypothetical protein [Clostridia bacterium]